MVIVPWFCPDLRKNHIFTPLIHTELRFHWSLVLLQHDTTETDCGVVFLGYFIILLYKEGFRKLNQSTKGSIDFNTL